MKANGRIGLTGVDTRALTRRIRQRGRAQRRDRPPRGRASSTLPALLEQARAWPGLEGMDLAKEVSCRQMYRWSGGAGGWARAMSEEARMRGLPPRRRHRLWLQAQHLPQPRRRRRAGDGAARDRDLRRGDGAQARRLLPLQRPRRSRRDRRICGAGDPADAGDRQAAVRHLPRPPIARRSRSAAAR